jgi:dihydrolipoamide dehydrogenase
MHDVIVIGGGPAGVTAALRAAELGAKVALVESSRLGGTCTNDGCVPTRALAKAARIRRDAEQYSDYGFSGSLPTLDFGDLMQRTQEIVFRIHEKKQLIRSLDVAGVDLHTQVGPAKFRDSHTIDLADGRNFSAEKFIVCIGGRPRRLPIPGAELALTHSDVWNLKKLPKSVVIIGAAATGCQLASIFADFGAAVSLVDLAERIVQGEDRDISAGLAASFERRGIQVMTGVSGVNQISARDGRHFAEISVEDTAVELEAEVIVQAVGWPGNVASIMPDNAGIHHENGFIQVDSNLRSSADHIFAAGDITGRMMLVQSAGYEARIAAENACSPWTRNYDHQIVPHGGFTDPEYGSVGPTEAQARLQGPIEVASVPFAALDRAVIDGYPDGFCKLIASKEDLRIIGAHVLGEQAVEIVQLVATGMSAGLTVPQLARLELAYPTYTAVVGLAARQLSRKLGLEALAPAWRDLGKDQVAEWEIKSS